MQTSSDSQQLTDEETHTVAETVSEAASGTDRPMTEAKASGLVFLTYPVILILGLLIVFAIVAWMRN